MVGSETSTERAVNGVYESLRARGLKKHVHSRRCMNILRHVLYRDEETLIESRQSYLSSIAPTRIVATRKRLIIVTPSFWGLYTGHDITSPTNYAIIPYKYIIGVSLSRGLVFSSIKIHTSGGIDTGAALNTEDEIAGIGKAGAARIATFIEEVIEREEHPYQSDGSEVAAQRRQPIRRNGPSTGIKVEEARQMVRNGARFLWLGVEPVEEVAVILGVEPEKIIQMSGTSLVRRTKAEVEAMPEIILISYDETLSGHTRDMVRKKFGVEMEILGGGINQTASELRDRADKFL